MNLGKEGYFPAQVYVLDGSVCERHEGFHNTKMVGTKVSGVEVVWPLAKASGDAILEVDGKRTTRMFLVSKDFPEFAIPWEQLPRAMIDWRNQAREDAYEPMPVPLPSANGNGVHPKNDAAETPLEAPKRFNEAKFVEKMVDFPISEARKHMLATVFAGDMTPEHTGQIAERRWVEALMSKAVESWPIVVGALLVGLLEGWQLADTVLPNVADSTWFALILPIVLIGAVVLLAIREG